MEAKFSNGATVSRAWSDNEEAELIAAFQYSGDAEDYAKRQAADDAKRDAWGCLYVVTNHYNGSVKLYRPKRPELAVAA